MKIDRLLSIIMILLNNDKVSAAKLAETFEVSRRTIYRDLDTIGMAGVPIVTSTGADGGVSIMKQYKVDKRFFTAQDIQKLIMGLNSVSAVMTQSDITGILEKVKGLLPKDQQETIRQIAEMISIDVNPWIAKKDFRPMLKMIQDAFSKKLIISFSYMDSKGEESERETEPYQLISKAGNWYVYAYCLKRSDFRLFRISRMKNPHLTEKIFTPRQYDKPEIGKDDDFRSKLGKATLIVHKSVVNQLIDIFGDLNFTKLPDERLQVDIPFMDDDFSYGIILRLGDKCECTEPVAVRHKLIQKLNKMNSIYS